MKTQIGLSFRFVGGFNDLLGKFAFKLKTRFKAQNIFKTIKGS